MMDLCLRQISKVEYITVLQLQLQYHKYSDASKVSTPPKWTHFHTACTAYPLEHHIISHFVALFGYR